MSSDDRVTTTTTTPAVCAHCEKECAADRRCARCRRVSYCDVACQRAHWRRAHKNECEVVRNSVADTGRTDEPAPDVALFGFEYMEKLRALAELRGVAARSGTPEVMRLLRESKIVYDGARETTLALSPKERDVVAWFVAHRTSQMAAVPIETKTETRGDASKSVGSNRGDSDATITEAHEQVRSREKGADELDGRERKVEVMRPTGADRVKEPLKTATPTSADERKNADAREEKGSADAETRSHDNMAVVALHPTRGAVVGSLVQLTTRALSPLRHAVARSSCDYAMDLYHDLTLASSGRATQPHTWPAESFVDWLSLDREMQRRAVKPGCAWFGTTSAAQQQSSSSSERDARTAISVVATPFFSGLFADTRFSALVSPSTSADSADRLVLFNLLPVGGAPPHTRDRISPTTAASSAPPPVDADALGGGGGVASTPMDATFDRNWRAVTADPPALVHSFLLLLCARGSCLLQSYASHYTFAGWTRWSRRLEPLTLPLSPTRPDHIGRVQSQPVYRGRLDADRIKTLYADLDALTRPESAPGSHARTYARITGVEFRAAHFPAQFSVLVRARQVS